MNPSSARLVRYQDQEVNTVQAAMETDLALHAASELNWNPQRKKTRHGIMRRNKNRAENT